MKELEAYKKIMSDLPNGIQEAEAQAEKNDRIVAGILNGEETGMSASDKTAIFVKASGIKTGMTYTQNLEADPKEVLLEAFKNSEFVQEEETEPLNGAYFESQDEDIEHISFDELLEKARELEAKVKEVVTDSSRIFVRVSENLRTTGIVNSLGLNRAFTKRIVEAELSLTCERGTHRSLELEASASLTKEIKAEYFTEKIKEWLTWPVNECSFTSTKVPAVLNASVMCNIFLTAWQMFSGYQYIHQSTPLYNKLGETIFPDILNISDLPRDSSSGYARQFDCEGATSQRVDVVKAGKFEALMHNLSTAKKAGTKSTGNAGRDVNLISDQTECRVIPTVFTLVEGETKKEELLKNLEEGIYICESYDMFHSVNTASGDFSIPCQGICYREGKIAGKVEGITINGNLIELLQNITMIGDDKTTVSMVMSKGFEISAVSVFVKELTVTGA